MKMIQKIFILVIVLVLGLQALQAQYAEDALRYSQLGLGVSARELGMAMRPLEALMIIRPFSGIQQV